MILPIDIFSSFKNKVKKELLLFNQVIKDTNYINLKQLNLKNSNNLSLILNKITMNNYQEKINIFLQEEFLTDNNALDKFTREIFFKMIQDIHFQYTYLKFYQEIISAYNFYGIKYDYSYLINLIESKYIMDIYHKDVLLSKIINDKLTSDKNLISNNIILISTLVKENILDKQLLNVIFNDLNDNHEFDEELFTFIKINNQEQFINSINLSNYNLRFQVLFNELKNDSKNNIIKNNDNKDKKIVINNLINNILEEYLFNDEFDDVILFINQNIKNNDHKNLFSQLTFDYYFEEENIKLIYLLQNLLKKNILSKNNISFGINNSINNNSISKNNKIVKNIIKIFNKSKNKIDI